MLVPLRSLIDWLNHFKSLWSAPRENAAEIVITMAILAIVAVILWIIFTLVRSFLHPPRRDGLVDLSVVPQNHLRLLKMTLYFAAASLVLLYIASISLPLVSNSSFCGMTCHSMNPAYQSWLRSDHAAVPCAACHDPDNVAVTVGSRLAASVNIFKEFSGRYQKPINADSDYGQKYMSNTACLRCHSPQNRVFTVRQGLNVTSKVHVEHLNASLKCVTCHNRIAHKNAETFDPLPNKNFAYVDHLRMKVGCWRCHSRGGIFQDAAGKKSIGPYVAPNGAQAPTACATCHNPNWDKKPAMHKPNDAGIPWKRGLTHGPVARQNFSACQACHDKNTWCTTECHKGVTMPHVSNWIKIHPTWAKANRQLCNMCHQADPSLNFCGNRCHHDPFRKQFNLPKSLPWKNGIEEHGVAALATKAAPCLRCHDQKTWCTTQCHGGITMTHVSNWRNIHYTYDRHLCVKCHNKDGTNNYFCFNCHHKEFGSFSNPLALMIYANKTYGINKVGRANISGPVQPCARCHGVGLELCRNCHSNQGRVKFRFLGVQDYIPDNEQHKLPDGIDSMFKNGLWPDGGQ